VAGDIPTTTSAPSVSSDEQQDLSALRLSEIDLEPVVSSHNVTASPADSKTTGVTDAVAKSEISRLSRDSDLSTSVDTKQRRLEAVDTQRPSVVTEAVSAAEVEKTAAANSQPSLSTSEVRSLPVSTVSQSSLPEQTSVDGDDKDIHATVSLFLFHLLLFCCGCMQECFACCQSVLHEFGWRSFARQLEMNQQNSFSSSGSVTFKVILAFEFLYNLNILQNMHTCIY